jgi:hypothetical protein
VVRGGERSSSSWGKSAGCRLPPPPFFPWTSANISSARRWDKWCQLKNANTGVSGRQTSTGRCSRGRNLLTHPSTSEIFVSVNTVDNLTRGNGPQGSPSRVAQWPGTSGCVTVETLPSCGHAVPASCNNKRHRVRGIIPSTVTLTDFRLGGVGAHSVASGPASAVQEKVLGGRHSPWAWARYPPTNSPCVDPRQAVAAATAHALARSAFVVRQLLATPICRGAVALFSISQVSKHDSSKTEKHLPCSFFKRRRRRRQTSWDPSSSSAEATTAALRSSVLVR